jgi:ABC-type branched-subunit amino acid transport system ATPase component/ABC-type branched-subunit amino acid transport system permease subunit
VITKRTTLGLHMRAVVDRRALASLRGVNPERVSTQGTVLGSTIAGLAGILIAPLFSLDANQFTVVMFIAAAAAVLGGLRSVPIAMLGGLVVGIAQSMVAGYVDINPSLLPGLRSSVPFVLLFVALFFLGKDRGRVASQVTQDAAPPDYLADLPPWRRALPWVCVVVVVLVWVYTASPFYVTLTSQGIALAIIFLSFVVITGAGGMVSLAQAAFAGFGALVAAALLEQGVGFVPSALAGGLAACLLGLLVALPSLRLGGVWLALSTLAAGFMADQVLFQMDWIRGGGAGRAITRPDLGPLDFNDPVSYALLLLVIFGVLALGVRNLLRSPTGRAMVSIRSSEVAAATSGASTVLPKLVLFGVSATIAGLGGTLLAANNLRADPLNYPTTLGMVWVAVIAVFGVRRIGGALLAGLMVPLFPELVRYVTDTTLLPPILFGLGAISLAQNPDGIMAIRGLKLQAKRRERSQRRAPSSSTKATTASASDRFIAARPTAPNPSGAEVALDLRSVCAGYDGVEVLHDVNLSIPKGAFVVIVGANGAGKSTLCSVMAGLVLPTAGSVAFGSVDITAKPAHERARRGLILAPESRGIFPGLTVEDNVAVWMPHGATRRAALERFPVLTERRHQPAQLLSGGEQQMLTLAPLLEEPPAMLIIDEPTLGLSPAASRQVFAALAEIHANGTTIVLAEEQARRALELAESVVMLSVGRVTWHGLARDVTTELTNELYLGKSAG